MSSTAAVIIFALTYLVLVTGEFPGFRVYPTSAALIGAGNLTVPGSVANLIVFEAARRRGVQIGALTYLRAAFR
jgi:Na+/H+ antiporter NhaD/arsenite permease-like protein